jgi:hypothetical protein
MDEANLMQELSVNIKGHVTIFEFDSFDDYRSRNIRNILLDKDNAVHKENASIVLARGITHRPNGSIFFMYFGNGGAVIDPGGNVILQSPNVSGAADLYNPSYFEAVDDTQGAPEGNGMDVRHITGSLYSDADVRCVIGRNEPLGQLPTDTVDSVDLNTEDFAFNEIGLKTADNLLITHLTFTPILKSAQRLIEVVYTLRISID